MNNQNLQCELEVCSSAESLFYRPKPKRLTESVSLAHHIYSQILKGFIRSFDFFLPANGSYSSNNVS